MSHSFIQQTLNGHLFCASCTDDTKNKHDFALAFKECPFFKKQMCNKQMQCDVHILSSSDVGQKKEWTPLRKASEKRQFQNRKLDNSPDDYERTSRHSTHPALPQLTCPGSPAVDIYSTSSYGTLSVSHLYHPLPKAAFASYPPHTP